MKENREIHRGYHANDLLWLKIQKIVPIEPELVKAFNWCEIDESDSKAGRDSEAGRDSGDDR